MSATKASEQPAQQPQHDNKGQQQQQQQQQVAEDQQQQPTQQFEDGDLQQEQQQQLELQAEQHAQIEQQQRQQQAPAQQLGHEEQQQQQQQQQLLDVYGFSLAGLTEQQLAARAACDAYEARRRAKWQAYADKQQLPEGAVLKRYCRKVRGSACCVNHMSPKQFAPGALVIRGCGHACC
jgi:hypothetical protein